MIQNTIELKLTSTRLVSLTHPQFCRLLVSTINWKRAHLFTKHVSYKSAFHEAEMAVKADESSNKAGNIAISLSDNRLNKIISDPPAGLRADELAFFTRAFDLYFRKSVPDEAWDAIVRSMGDQTGENREGDSGRTASDDSFKHLGLLSNILGLARIPASQARLSYLAGDYILFRRVRGKRLLAAHFIINAPPSSDKPATFLTLGSAGGAVQESRQVEGIIYEPLEAPGIFFAIGKITNSSEIRMSVLKGVDKPTRLDNPPANFIDLVGIRLGLGRTSRAPLAYRIWCARMIDELPRSVHQSYVREYTLDQARNFFSDKVIGFDYILKWLNNPRFVTLHDDDDPVLE